MRACIYILLLTVLQIEGVHQNYSYFDCKAGYLAPHETRDGVLTVVTNVPSVQIQL